MKKTVFLVIMLGSMMFATIPASAAIISLVPGNQQISTGGVASVDLVVGGLGNFEAPSLGAFSFDISFDPTVLSITDADIIFGSLLGDPSLFEADTFGEVSGGIVRLYETSFLFSDELDALQSDTFTLATLNFTGIGIGTSALSFEYGSLSDAFGFEEVSSLFGAEVHVTGPAPIPEPTSLLLLSSGILGLAGLAKLRKKA